MTAMLAGLAEAPRVTGFTPAVLEGPVAVVRGLLGRVPVFGICLGHQIAARALGASTFKLKFGHRGANQPVRNVITGRVEITSQNHGFCVEPDSLEAADCEITHVHLNDGTVAGFRHRSRPLFSVQFHPEMSAAAMSASWQPNHPELARRYRESPRGRRLLLNFLVHAGLDTRDVLRP